jgi:hypothetical protein
VCVCAYQCVCVSVCLSVSASICILSTASCMHHSYLSHHSSLSLTTLHHTTPHHTTPHRTMPTTHQHTLTPPPTVLPTGTYVFYMSDNRDKSLIVSVVAANLKCSTAAVFSEATQGSLIAMGVVTNPSLVLAPDWNLISGLLGGEIIVGGMSNYNSIFIFIFLFLFLFFPLIR